MPQRAPGDLTEDPGSFFLMLEHVFVLQGDVCLCFFWGMCFFNCLEGTGIEGTPIGEKFLVDSIRFMIIIQLVGGIQNFQSNFVWLPYV